jgi:hypothetical protein
VFQYLIKRARAYQWWQTIGGEMAKSSERDLRSLERRSMFSIFAPLDPDERVPREQLPVRGVGFGEGRIPPDKRRKRSSQRLLELLDARQASRSFSPDKRSGKPPTFIP